MSSGFGAKMPGMHRSRASHVNGSLYTANAPYQDLRAYNAVLRILVAYGLGAKMLACSKMSTEFGAQSCMQLDSDFTVVSVGGGARSRRPL